MCFAPQPRAIFEHRNFQNGSDNEVFCAFSLANVLRATAACHVWTSELPKWLRQWGVLCIFTCKCASRHSRVPFLNIGTSKMAPTMRCFVHFHLQMCFAPQRRAIFEHRNFWKAPRMWCFAHFDLQMCFAPQRRAIFRHRNFKKCSDTVSFLPFSLANVLFATAACHFSPVRCTATSAPAALARLLFERQEPRTIEKTQRFATSLTFFAHVPSFRWLYTRVHLLEADLTSVVCLTPLLCFSTLHIVGS